MIGIKNKLKIGLALGLVLVMAVAVTGCTTSNTSTPSTSALTMTAKQVSTSTLNGEPVAKINATIQNEHAGTIRLTRSNFELEDYSSQVHSPISTSGGGITIDNGEGAWMQTSFYIAEGSHPTKLTSYDGTNKVVCSVDL